MAYIRKRQSTRQVKAGSVLIGGDAPISLQSMTNIPLVDIKGTIRQICDLQALGADIIRLAVRTEEELPALKEVINSVTATLTADVHFNYRIAIGSIEAGIHKIRINPGNIGSSERVREVVAAAKDAGVPIRVGVNGGSIDSKRFPSVTPEALVESAMEHVEILEDFGFEEIIVSMKSSDIFQTIEANKLFAARRNYPLHIGLTEAGYGLDCTVNSSIALGHLLLSGYGDTMRVSMTGDPREEIKLGKKILESVGERFRAIHIIACPTCGRTDTGIDILSLAQELECICTDRFKKRLESCNQTLTVAVMGCEVNGPGEAAHADVGLAGGRSGQVLLFSRGAKLKKVKVDLAVAELVEAAEKIVAEKCGR